MGNPQERALAWLAGVLEAEGSISFQTYIKENGCLMIQPFLCVVNSDKAILDECERILKEILGDTKNAMPRMCGGKVAVNKKCWTLRLDGRSVGIILKALMPFFIGDKKKNAQIVSEYIDNREKIMLSRDKLGRLRRNGYTKTEVDLVCSIRTHKRAQSSETLCRAANVVS